VAKQRGANPETLGGEKPAPEEVVSTRFKAQFVAEAGGSANGLQGGHGPGADACVTGICPCTASGISNCARAGGKEKLCEKILTFAVLAPTSPLRSSERRRGETTPGARPSASGHLSDPGLSDPASQTDSTTPGRPCLTAPGSERRPIQPSPPPPLLQAGQSAQSAADERPDHNAGSQTSQPGDLPPQHQPTQQPGSTTTPATPAPRKPSKPRCIFLSEAAGIHHASLQPPRKKSRCQPSQ